MNPRRLILVGGTVAFTAIGVVKRTRRPPRQPRRSPVFGAVVAVPLIGGVVFALPNMPDLSSIFLQFWNIGNLIWDQIWNIVYNILQQVMALINEAIDTAFNAVDQTIEAVIGTIGVYAQKIETVSRAVGGMIVETTNRIDGAFANFRQNLTDFMQGVWGDITDFITDSIPDLIGGVIGDGWDIIKGLIELGTDGVSLLLNFARDPIGFVWDLISDLVQSLIDSAMDVAGFTWDAFWGLFWPLLARQLGLPEDPQAMIDAAKLLFTVALMLVRGEVDDAWRELVKGAGDYFEQKVPQVVHQYSDLLVSLIYEAMGIDLPQGKVKEMLDGV